MNRREWPGDRTSREREYSRIKEFEKEVEYLQAVIDKCTPNDYLRTLKENERLKEQVKQLEKMKGLKWRQ